MVAKQDGPNADEDDGPTMATTKVDEEDPVCRIARLELLVDRLQNTGPVVQIDLSVSAPLPSSLPVAHIEIVELRRILKVQQEPINDMKRTITQAVTGAKVVQRGV